MSHGSLLCHFLEWHLPGVYAIRIIIAAAAKFYLAGMCNRKPQTTTFLTIYYAKCQFFCNENGSKKTSSEKIWHIFFAYKAFGIIVGVVFCISKKMPGWALCKVCSGALSGTKFSEHIGRLQTASESRLNLEPGTLVDTNNMVFMAHKHFTLYPGINWWNYPYFVCPYKLTKRWFRLWN